MDLHHTSTHYFSALYTSIPTFRVVLLLNYQGILIILISAAIHPTAPIIIFFWDNLIYLLHGIKIIKHFYFPHFLYILYQKISFFAREENMLELKIMMTATPNSFSGNFVAYHIFQRGHRTFPPHHYIYYTINFFFCQLVVSQLV